MNAQPAMPDFEAIKTKQNAAWSSGDYAKVGTTLQIVGESLAEAVDLKPGSRILDVAAGNGNATLAFARRFHNVTSTDYVPSLLDGSKARANAEGLSVDYQVADAENLPFKDGEFDAAVSTFGVMFTPNQKQSASELVRVTRSGGKIGMANWTPESFIGRLFKVIGAHVPPPEGVKSPALWGHEVWLEETFSSDASSMLITNSVFNFRYESPAEFLRIFRDFYGPTHKAFLALDEAGQASLASGILELVDSMNEASDGSMKVPGEYLEVVITRK